VISRGYAGRDRKWGDTSLGTSTATMSLHHMALFIFSRLTNVKYVAVFRAI
jgi:hypothetical protein